MPTTCPGPINALPLADIPALSGITNLAQGFSACKKARICHTTSVGTLFLNFPRNLDRQQFHSKCSHSSTLQTNVL